MSTPLEIMLMGGPQDADMQRALSSGLRRRKDIGELAQLTGDPSLSKFGQNLTRDVGRQQSLAVAKQDKEAQRKLTGGYYEQMAKQFGEQHTLAMRKQDEIERRNKWIEKHGTQQERRLKHTMQKEFDNNVRKYSETMTRLGVPELKRDVLAAQDILAPYLEEGADIPGLGATGWLPETALSTEGLKVRQALARIRNKLLKVRSGAAVTDPEMARFAEELGARIGGIGTDEQLKLAWPEIVQSIKAIESGISAGYQPEVIATWEQRYADRQRSDPTAVGTAAAIEQQSSGKVVEWSSL